MALAAAAGASSAGREREIFLDSNHENREFRLMKSEDELGVAEYAHLLTSWMNAKISTAAIAGKVPMNECVCVCVCLFAGCQTVSVINRT